jgi:hypothetical protein
MKVTQKFDEPNKMRIEPGDTIIVIDGRYLSHWHFPVVHCFIHCLGFALHFLHLPFLFLVFHDIPAIVGHLGEQGMSHILSTYKHSSSH